MPTKIFCLRLGYACNNNCQMCFFSEKLNSIDMTTEEAKKAMMDARKEKASNLQMTGGEPTIREDFLELLSYAVGLGFDGISLQTNGRFFYYKKFVQKISNILGDTLKLNIVVPLYGKDEKVHDAITRVPGSFKQTYEGIKNLVKHENLRPLLKTIIMKTNFRELTEIVKLVPDLGIRKMTISSMCISKNMKQDTKRLLPRFSNAVPYLSEALDYAQNNNIKVGLSSIPLCLIRNYTGLAEDDIFYDSLTGKRPHENTKNIKIPKNAKKDFSNKTKIRVCEKCDLNSRCGGIWKGYLEVYGEEEFSPIRL